MVSKTAVVFASLLAVASACDQHTNYLTGSHLGKRQRTIPQDRDHDWAYEASYNWHTLNDSYSLCQEGTQQSPIPLRLDQGLSLQHQPSFSGYPNASVEGNFYNWGYGPAFTLAHAPGVWNTLPSMRFDNLTVYLRGWHIHAPADHSVQQDRSKAEMHFVHCDEFGIDKAVVAMRIDPGNAPSPFFSQLPPMIGFNELEVENTTRMDPGLALASVGWFNEFWTYRGSLTSPPCREGIRWFLARTILFTSVDQLQSLLRVSTFSARAEQEVWRHEINV
ncbi:hypothetical protein LTS18_005097 [Coniosporium uncinatum]|uniref:Uncharacterized protein n=1 Tax=Coniosporium uncinatum TaxID=93489 RepID=A0ACC3DRQ4_9PEZI|nr:hypothetical protein LTS18_005097 [Coniosporium uncinatum]